MDAEMFRDYNKFISEMAHGITEAMLTNEGLSTMTCGEVQMLNPNILDYCIKTFFSNDSPFPDFASAGWGW